jgi:hypothetical protein
MDLKSRAADTDAEIGAEARRVRDVLEAAR